MSSETIVLKFGGSSVATAERWDTIAEVIFKHHRQGRQVVLVLSALRGTTDLLERLLDASERGEREALASQVRNRHQELVVALGMAMPSTTRRLLERIESTTGLAGADLDRTENLAHRADTLAVGEQLCVSIAVPYLCARGIAAEGADARHLLRSEVHPGSSDQDHFLSAHCRWDYVEAEAKQWLTAADVQVVPGFMAADGKGRTVLLGRGGSDTSATLIAARIRARGVEIWTDVAGLFSADPRIVPGAKGIRFLQYDEAREIATTGSRVLHPRCVRPVQEAGIPLLIRSTLAPSAPGTEVGTRPVTGQPPIKAISVKRGIILVAMETVGMWHQPGFLADAFAVFRTLGISVDLVSTSETNVSVSIDPAVRPVGADELKSLRTGLARLCRVSIIRGCASISLVGQGVRRELHRIGAAMNAFSRERIHLVTQAANDLNFTLVVDETRVDHLLVNLHARLIENRPHDGPIVSTGRGTSSAPSNQAWWWGRQAELIEVMGQDDAAFVYCLGEIDRRARTLRELGAIDRWWYAMKANSHPAIINRIVAAGLGLECASLGEMQLALEHAAPSRVLFTPNFAPRREFEFAVRAGVHVTLDGIHPLLHWADLVRGQELILRLDLGQGRGHHAHVRTAGSHAKFGIPLPDLPRALELANQTGCAIVGLHSHAGSGVTDALHWPETARALLPLAAGIQGLRYLNLGGGLGVSESLGEPPLDLTQLQRALSTLRDEHPHPHHPGRCRYDLWMEPGRFLVADSGVLLARVTQVKSKEGHQFVGVATGMNSLIRPALYGAWHPIVNLSKPVRKGDDAPRPSTVVGPICESADFLGRDRLLPACEEGDILLIGQVGAYGRAMASTYNARPPAEEIVIA